MISQKEMLNIICTEAVEYGGLQEIPGQQHGGRTAFHSAKRPSRKIEEGAGTQRQSDSRKMKYRLRLVKKANGTVEWVD